MARFSVGYRTTAAGSATIPMASIYATAAVQPRIVEVGVFNTTTTAVNVALARLTTTGTQGITVAGVFENDDSQAAVTTPKQSHTVGPTIGTTNLRITDLGAAIGSGVIWTFGGGSSAGLLIPNATTNGIGLYTPNGTGQVCDVYWVWDE